MSAALASALRSGSAWSRAASSASGLPSAQQFARQLAAALFESRPGRRRSHRPRSPDRPGCQPPCAKSRRRARLGTPTTIASGMATPSGMAITSGAASLELARPGAHRAMRGEQRRAGDVARPGDDQDLAVAILVAALDRRKRMALQSGSRRSSAVGRSSRSGHHVGLGGLGGALFLHRRAVVPQGEGGHAQRLLASGRKS